jgi:RimJ/RimL family protein N-acetyltransferase
MLIATTPADFTTLIAGGTPRGLAVAPGGIETTEILEMLAGVAQQITASFAPAAWMIAERDEIIGMISITALPAAGVIDIGYGIAASRRRQGVATRAIADLLGWAATDTRVITITAATAPENLASQRVLAANGFVQSGTRIDPEDGPLLLWHRNIAAAANHG